MRKIQIEAGFKTRILLWLLIAGLFFNGFTNLIRPTTSSAQTGTTRVYVTGGELDKIDKPVEIEGLNTWPVTVKVEGTVTVDGSVDIDGTVNTCETCQY